MDRKYKIEFDEANVQDSVAYILVTEFDLRPNVLKAEIAGDGSGVMILGLDGEDEKLDKAEKRLIEAGFMITELAKRIDRDDDLCWNCGECVSICPVGCFVLDPETFKVTLDNSKCIACGSCLNACSVHSLSLHL